MNINVHDCKFIRAEFTERNGTSWVVLSFNSNVFSGESICIFFNNADVARNTADAINAVLVTEPAEAVA